VNLRNVTASRLPLFSLFLAVKVAGGIILFFSGCRCFSGG
jgi:small neutral amino acid transporter SnatA (MarC family)